MKTLKNIAFVTIALGMVHATFAGNPDRAGSAGAGQLRINPWARSNGLANANVATVEGAEAIFMNVAGLAFTQKTDLVYNYTNYLSGADIDINSIGFAQKMGESSVIGVNVTMFGFGDLERTTTDNPDGGIGTFSPSFTNIGVSYAKSFSNSIFGGITLRLISESSSEVKASGIAFDAGIRYITGPRDNVKFGISLKNVGPPYQYGGDGVSRQVILDEKEITTDQRVDQFELPALVNIGLAYDIYPAEKHRVTPQMTFTSNSFDKDLFQFGLEYSFKELFTVRGGYMLERDDEESTSIVSNIMTGPAGGFSIGLPFGKNKSRISIDYSFRPTDPFDGVHTIGARLDIR